MSDLSVAAALRSKARLVVIEAPAGCGKTYQGSGYALDHGLDLGHGRLLVLAHTHAACDVFAARARGRAARVEIRTIDSLIAQIAAAYHAPLSLPADPAAWARRNPAQGYKELAAKVALLVTMAPMVAGALVERYPVVLCDEHQDCSEDQHTLAMALHGAGSVLRVFGDPMQRIYGGRAKDVTADAERWSALVAQGELIHVARRCMSEWSLAARNASRDCRGVLRRTER